jgi:TRAP-type uncharacterized transport system substrate-binding protein
MMNKTIICGTLAMIFASTASYADFTVVTGREGGTYYAVQGPKIVKFLKGAGIKNATFIPSGGSLDNLEKVSNGQAEMGIAQADAIMYFKKTHPKEGISIEIGGPLGKECIFITAKKDGKINNDSDLQKAGVSIAAGANGDGSRASWDYMGILEEGFKKPTVFDYGGATGLAKVPSGNVDAFIFVTNPDPSVLFNNELFSYANANKSLKWIPVTDWDLNDKLPNGDQVYTFENVITKPGLFGSSLDTICVNTYTFYNTNLDDTTKEAISRSVLRMESSKQ